MAKTQEPSLQNLSMKYKFIQDCAAGRTSTRWQPARAMK